MVKKKLRDIKLKPIQWLEIKLLELIKNRASITEFPFIWERGGKEEIFFDYESEGEDEDGVHIARSGS